MNINPLSILGSYLRSAKEIRRGEKRKASSSVSGSDRVEISGPAKEVERFSGMVSLEPDVRVERVSDVEEKIVSGKHNPTDKEMAESLVKSTIMDNIL